MFRLGRDAWPLFKCLRQPTNEYPAPSSIPLVLVFIWRLGVVTTDLPQRQLGHVRGGRWGAKGVRAKPVFAGQVVPGPQDPLLRRRPFPLLRPVRGKDKVNLAFFWPFCFPTRVAFFRRSSVLCVFFSFTPRTDRSDRSSRSSRSSALDPITGVHSNQDQILCVKIGLYMSF